MDKNTDNVTNPSEDSKPADTPPVDYIRASIEGRHRRAKQVEDAKTDAVAHKVAAIVVAAIGGVGNPELVKAKAEISALTAERDALRNELEKAKAEVKPKK